MKDKINPVRLIFKTAAVIALIALVLIPAAGNAIGRLSLYNTLVPGRMRFPYSDTPKLAYNLSPYNLEALFASHQVAGSRGASPEYRVFLMGDSSTWGTLLKPEETLAGQLNEMELVAPDGKPVRFFNLGYPTLSLTKDLTLLDKALAYQPDLIVWIFTLESFPEDKQLTSPLIANNLPTVTKILDRYRISFPFQQESPPDPSYWDSTLFGQRRNLADIVRLQLYGVMWAITGIDQYYPADYEPAARDLTADTNFHGWEDGEMNPGSLASDVLLAGRKAAQGIPLLYINEPILISEGRNSDIRYNFYYPIWAYDQYRQIISDLATAEGLNYLDLWNLVPQAEFTNTAIHTTPAGVRLTAERIADPILELLDP